MRVVLLRALALAFSMGTLGYIVAHAAATAGCSMTPEPASQFPPRAPASPFPIAEERPEKAVPSAAHCAPVYMMPATKAAAVFRPDECTPSSPGAHQQRALPGQNQNPQQAAQ
jgi:hypothetical protein